MAGVETPNSFCNADSALFLKIFLIVLQQNTFFKGGKCLPLTLDLETTLDNLDNAKRVCATFEFPRIPFVLLPS